MIQQAKQDLIKSLQRDILLLEGFKSTAAQKATRFGLGAIESAFPNSVFPTGAIHEFLCVEPEHAAAASGFIAGILKILMQKKGACIWVSTSKKLFPLSLSLYGVPADRLIFIKAQNEMEVLWVMEQALKYDGLSSVVAEVREMNIVQSRRLQLAVEHSKVTGFLLRNDPQKLGANTCVARWKVSHLPSKPDDGLPGVGMPRWQVDLLRVRNGNPGSWKVEWSGNDFVDVDEKDTNIPSKVVSTGHYA